jgi:hypothetical protein
VSNLWTYREPAWADGRDIVGYDVEASDGSIGKIDQATAEADSAHMVVDTGWWIFGKKRLIPAGAIAAVDHENQTVSVRLTKDQIKDAPDFDAAVPLDRTNRSAYDDYYTPFGW